MTEAEWLACENPDPMLEFLRGKASDRKLRLFAVGCCRMKWESLTDETSRHAVVLSEKFADGAVSRQALKKIRRTAWERRFPVLAGWHAADLWAWQAACTAASSIAPQIGTERGEPGMRSQCDLLRDIFGNPFRPVTLDPSWLTSTVTSLAQAIYADRAFDRLPILADTLEDAGCTNQEILAHCRGGGEHVRGCWVVDLLLGKS
jgi:hypothetical protein